MAAKCDDREYARSIAGTPRQLRVINELLTRKPVLIGDGRIGTAGLARIYWDENIMPRMQSRGFTFVFLERGDNHYVVATYPGEG